MARMIELSMLDSNYRSRLLLFLKGDAFMVELRRDLATDPALGQFSKAERTAIVQRWIPLADQETIEAYLDTYGETLDRLWFIRSHLLKEQGRFKEALEVLRLALPVPEVPKVEMNKKIFVRLKREFSFGPTDVMKGTALLRVYLDEAAYSKALQVAVALLEVSDPPVYAYYWQAELLYQMEDYVESWYAFEAYLEHVQ
jgi:tetratricopeptide (TPR) repeat protein